MSSNRSLDINWGGLFFNTPAPLHLVLNRCSHSCLYCFANINDNDRKAYVQQIINTIKNFRENKTYLGYLLRQKAVIDFSNLVDPFARNNYKLALNIIEILTEYGFQFSFATRGGHGLNDALDMISPSVFYTSIPFLNEDLRRKIEPLAPSIEDRLLMIETLKAKGHKVLVGINPFVPEWQPDIVAIVETLENLNIDGIWTQLIHFSNSQINKLAPKVKENLGDYIFDNLALIRQGKLTEWESKLIELRELIINKNIPHYNNQQSLPSKFFDCYKEVYQNINPTFQEWVNYCYENHQSGDLIYIDEWIDFYLPLFPDNNGFNLRDYINATHIIGSLHGLYIPTQINNWREFLIVCWQYYELMFCPCNCDCFAYLTVETEGKVELLLDEKTRQPILVFMPEGSDNKKFVSL